MLASAGMVFAPAPHAGLPARVPLRRDVHQPRDPRAHELRRHRRRTGGPTGGDLTTSGLAAVTGVGLDLEEFTPLRSVGPAARELFLTRWYSPDEQQWCRRQ